MNKRDEEAPRFQTFSVRARAETLDAYRNLSAATGRETSELIREALDGYLISKSPEIMEEVTEQQRRREAAAHAVMDCIAEIVPSTN